MANTAALGQKEQCEMDLYDARNVADSLRTKVTALESQLQDKTALAANLQAENDRLHQAFDTCQSTLASVADRRLPDTPVIVKTMLPEKLDSALKQFASQYPSAVEYDEQRGIVRWKSDLLFALGSDVVMDSAKEALAGFAEIMRSADASSFDTVVVGHTDNRPISRDVTRREHPTNWHLSVHRSISVSNVLQGAGLPPQRIGVMGYGEFRPVHDNGSESNRASNRRVEVYIVPTGTVALASAS
jgi:chemotaxis protein MotB